MVVAVDFSPSGASKSNGMVEVCNKLLEEVLRKDSSHTEWDYRIPKGASNVNGRVIRHLSYSSKAILFGHVQETSATTATLLALPGREIRAWVAELEDPESHARVVTEYSVRIADVRDSVIAASNLRKDAEADRYNKGIGLAVHHIGDSVMLHPEKTGKLQPRWRGAFQIKGCSGTPWHKFSPHGS